MAISWIIVSVATCLYFCYWYWRPKNSPPGPRGIPILGVVPFLGKYLERKIHRWSKVYGPIMTVRIGTEDQVVLDDYETVIQAYVKQSATFSGRPRLEFMEQFAKGHGIILVDYGDRWKSQRKFGTAAFRRFSVGKESMEGRIIQEAENLNNSIQSEDGKAFNIAILLKYATVNTVCSFIMGRRLDYEDPRFREIMTHLFGQFSNPVENAIFRLLMFLPTLKHVPPFYYYNKGIMDNYYALMKLLEEIIKEHEETYDSNIVRDFIDAFIKEKKKNQDLHFTDFQLINYVRNLFIGGTETSSTAIYWALLCCLHYPDTQIKLREEIINVLGPEGAISMSKKNEMPYVNAFIHELHRFRTIGPLGFPHKTSEDTELGGYFIRKGTTVISNVWAIHNEPQVFHEPEKFKPERFLDEEGNFQPSNRVIPYGVGPRRCLGMQLAEMEIFVYLVGMIQKFEFLPDPAADQLPDIDDGANGLTFAPFPYTIVAKPL